MNIDKLISQLQSRINTRGNEIVEYEKVWQRKHKWFYPNDKEMFDIELKLLREQQTLDKRLLGVLIKQRRGNLWYTNSGYKEYKFRVSLCMLKNANNLDVGVDFL